MMKFKISLLVLFVFSSVFFACSDDSGMSPDPDNPTLAKFSSIQSTIFTPSCALSGCHNGTQTPNLSSRVAYNNIINVLSSFGIDYIEPNDPDNSYLFRKLTGSDISGGRMPRGAARLSSARLDSIKLWIENGALEN